MHHHAKPRCKADRAFAFFSSFSDSAISLLVSRRSLRLRLPGSKRTRRPQKQISGKRRRKTTAPAFAFLCARNNVTSERLLVTRSVWLISRSPSWLSTRHTHSSNIPLRSGIYVQRQKCVRERLFAEILCCVYSQPSYGFDPGAKFALLRVPPPGLSQYFL